MAATASGIVDRKEEDDGITRVAFDLNILGGESPVTLTAYELNNYGLNLGFSIGQKINTMTDI